MNERNDSRIGPVLLTGGNGFVGSRIARRLVAAGRRVRAIVRSREAASELTEPALEGLVEIVEDDFTSPKVANAAASGASAVVHCAATGGPDMDTARRVNREGTRAMVQAAERARVRRYVQISTISVYARGPEGLFDEDAPLKEDGDPYGVTKAEADRVVLEATGRGLPAVILRPGAILGVHPTSTWAVRMPARIRDGQVKLRGDGRETIPWVHVEDLAEAALLALDDPRAVGRVYNVAEGAVTWRQYTDEARRWFGAPALGETPPEEFGGYWMGRFDASRIRRELNYRPRHGYEEGMAEAADYWARERTAQGS